MRVCVCWLWYLFLYLKEAGGFNPLTPRQIEPCMYGLQAVVMGASLLAPATVILMHVYGCRLW